MGRKESVLNCGADRSEQECDDYIVTASVRNGAVMAVRSMGGPRTVFINDDVVD